MGARLTIDRKAREDRISELPDDVLCHILSFLSTKEGVVTSLLSRRWRFLWSMVPSLHIECSKPIMKFYERVDIFLGLRRTEKITRFHLKCNSHHCCSRYMEEWVYAVAARKVKHVNISLSTCHTMALNFAALFICTTLVTLKLEGLFHFSIPCIVHLPNLKSFHLHVNPSISNLISGSRTLELFHMEQKQYYFDELKIVCNSQVNKVFHYNWLYGLVIQGDRDYDFISDYIDNHCWPNIVKAKVYMTVYRGTQPLVSNILQGLRNVEFLSLGDFRVEMTPSTLDLPNFENLVELRLFLRNADSVLMELPAKCPKLEVFEVNIMDDRYGINQRCRYHITGGVREHDLSIVPFFT